MNQHSTESAPESESEITFNIGGWFTASGATPVSIVLDPEDLRVYTFNAIGSGSGTPMAVHHGRHRVLGHVPVETVPDALQEALEAQEGTIRNIASRYIGTRWDGANIVGRWADDVAGGDAYPDEYPEIDLDLEDVARYSDAEDWLAADERGVISEALVAAARGRDLDAVAADEARRAADDGVIIDDDAMRDAIDVVLRRHAAGLDLDDEDQRRDRLTIAQLLDETRPPVVRCQCGATCGVPCDLVIVRANGVVVEWMPPYLRGSHEAAGNEGRWPHNGAQRLLVDDACAERIVESDPKWASIVEVAS